MTTRLALLDLVARAGLDERQASRLWRLAGLHAMPPSLPARLRLGVTLTGAGCAGLGLIFWVAANWALLSRLQQFVLLQTLVFAPCAAAAASGRGRAACGLLALFCTGGLFAYFGQTYQTGADPWQLFAVWAALTLPLAWFARSDAVWAGWAVVALTGIALWERSGTGFLASLHGVNVGLLRIAGTSGMAGLTVALSGIVRRHTGAGNWAFGIALALTTAWVTTTAVKSLLWDYSTSPVHYAFALMLAAGAASSLAKTKPFDVLAASVVALGINVLLVAGLGKMLLSGHGDEMGSLLMLGLLAAGLLGGSVSLIMSLQRAGATPPGKQKNAEAQS